MRNIVHHAIVITSNEKDKIELVRNKAFELYGLHMETKNGKALVGPLTIGLINNFYTFLICPDGSKEGYDTSDDGDIVRNKICSFIESLQETTGTNPVNYVEVSYGADDGTAKIINHN
jgi:hypothetical protein